jgi:hypothetical protein
VLGAPTAFGDREKSGDLLAELRTRDWRERTEASETLQNWASPSRCIQPTSVLSLEQNRKEEEAKVGTCRHKLVLNEAGWDH